MTTFLGTDMNKKNTSDSYSKVNICLYYFPYTPKSKNG